MTTPDERVIDAGLQRLLGARQAPDLSGRIADAVAAGASPVFARPPKHESDRLLLQAAESLPGGAPGLNPAAPTRPVPARGSLSYLVATVAAVAAMVLLAVLVNVLGNGPDAVNNRFAPDQPFATSTPPQNNAIQPRGDTPGASSGNRPAVGIAQWLSAADFQKRVDRYLLNLPRVSPDGSADCVLISFFDCQEDVRYNKVGDRQMEVDGDLERHLFYVLQPARLSPPEQKQSLVRGQFVPAAQETPAAWKLQTVHLVPPSDPDYQLYVIH